MGYSGKRYDIERLSGQSLAVSQCGMTSYTPGYETPSAVYSHYSVHFILSGKGSYTIMGKTYNLRAGDGFLIIPDVPVSYRADSQDPWTYIYANFYGLDDTAIVRYAGLSEETVTFSYDMTGDMLRDIHAMHRAAADKTCGGYNVIGYFMLVMSRLVKGNNRKNAGSCPPHQYVEKAITFIHDNYSDSITVSEVARFVGIDRSYLHRLFIKTTGISPSAYITDYRLKKAAVLIEQERLPISHIAQAAGFYDSAHFTKAFSEKYGVTPGKYRSAHKS